MAKKPERFLLKWYEGAFHSADGYTAKRLREKGYRNGDLALARLTKPRNPGYHRLAHYFGQIVSENVDSFTGLDAHRVLKRLQWESGIGCEEMGVEMPGWGFTLIRLPQSLSFADMDQGEFEEVFHGLCDWVARRYWPDLTAEQVAEMAETMPEIACSLTET